MKFGKEFEVQMMQEWQEAYVDYSNLKSILKDILKFKQLNNAPSPMAATRKGKSKRNASLYRAFSGLTSRFRPDSTLKNNEDEVILVSAVQGGDGKGITRPRFSGQMKKELNMNLFSLGDLMMNSVRLSSFTRRTLQKLLWKLMS